MIDLMSWRRVTTLNKNDATMEQGKELVKRKMKPRGGNSPVIGDNGVHTKPGDNSKTVSYTHLTLPTNSLV